VLLGIWRKLEGFDPKKKDKPSYTSEQLRMQDAISLLFSQKAVLESFKIYSD
jgi:hypothetical protein